MFIVKNILVDIGFVVNSFLLFKEFKSLISDESLIIKLYPDRCPTQFVGLTLIFMMKYQRILEA